MPNLPKKAKNFFNIASRFRLISLIATGIHFFLVWIILLIGNHSEFVANLYAFTTSFIFSFFGHYFFTFSQPGQFIKSLKRFFIIYFFAFIINNLFLIIFLYFDLINPIVSTLIAIFVVPIVVLIASFFWVFANLKDSKNKNNPKLSQSI